MVRKCFTRLIFVACLILLINTGCSPPNEAPEATSSPSHTPRPPTATAQPPTSTATVTLTSTPTPTPTATWGYP